MELEVREAIPDDAAPITVAHVGAWQAAYVGLMPEPCLDALDVERFAANWRQRLAELDAVSRTIIVADDVRVFGFASYGAARDAETGDDGELYAINVHPDHWGHGVGRALLHGAQAGLAELQHARATLWVLAGNDRAVRFYERHGWRYDGHRRHIEIGGGPVTEIRYARTVP